MYNHGQTIRPWSPGKDFWLAFACQACVLSVVSLDSTILTAALPRLAHAMEADTLTTFWIVTSYLLASAVVQPVMASLSDIYGRRRIFFCAVVAFTIGTVLCASAHSIPQILVGRSVQGVGGGGILAVNLVILSDALPLRFRAKYIGLMQAISSLAITIGPIVGGALVQASWRWLFYINLPFCTVGIIAVPLVLKKDEKSLTAHQSLSELDWLGSFLFLSGSTSFLLGVCWGGSRFSWNSGQTLGPALGGFALTVLSIARAWTTKRPFLRIELFQSWTSCIAFACTMLQCFTLFGNTYFLNLYFLAIRRYSPIESGLVFLAYASATLPIAAVTGYLITRLGSYKWAILFGWIINTFGTGSFMVLDSETPLEGMIFILFVGGLGQGILFSAHQTATQASCAARSATHAITLFSFLRSFGFCLGVSLGGTIFRNMLRHELILENLPLSIAAHAEDYALFFRASASASEQQAVMITYRRALHHFFATMVGVSGLGLLLSICMKECSLDVDFEIPGEEQIEGLRPVKRQSDKPVVRFHGNIAQLEKMPTIEEMALESGDWAVQGSNDSQSQRAGSGKYASRCTAPLT
ncbi:hypothetical protein D0865_06469 [Hortaea werneckii]|uniref:Major facilitator superfamily (MFS) profile domain-containing protein n=1 Tax=Hortaea werneckii TaxID=91943 RepID=A0A3M7CHT4_HORWE|nr:hypothetical protein D0865_06469 [Hortaea werneckii]